MAGSIRVPASSANLGAGFDVLAMALGVHARLGFDGDRAPERARPADEFHPATVAYRQLGGERRIWVESPIPAGKGIGFSGAMRVGGVALAVLERGDHDAAVVAASRDEILAVSAQLEGHADNAAASVYGGVVVTTGERVVQVPIALTPAVVLWVPAATTSTNRARAGLPDHVPMADAVFNAGRAAMFVAALGAGDIAALLDATEDRLHQAHRFARAPDSRAALDAGLAAGAWCGWLSGSGPTVAFLCAPDAAPDVVAGLPPGGHAKVAAIDLDGVTPI